MKLKELPISMITDMFLNTYQRGCDQELTNMFHYHTPNSRRQSFRKSVAVVTSFSRMILVYAVCNMLILVPLVNAPSANTGYRTLSPWMDLDERSASNDLRI